MEEEKIRHFGFLFLTSPQREIKLVSVMILIRYGSGKVYGKFGALFKICTMLWKFCSYALHYKWRLRENVILLLMECLTPSVSFDVFMDDYFTFFRLLTHLGVNNLWATRVLNKNSLHKCTIIGDEQLQKKERGLFEQRTFSKRAV